MAKYNMSMCALGMAEEFRANGIASNCLWPKTAIFTAAMEMLGGGGDIKDKCRKPDIMSDAAYAILCRDSHKHTGNFYIDESVLLEEGITDFSSYAYKPGKQFAIEIPELMVIRNDMISVTRIFHLSRPRTHGRLLPGR